MTTTVEERFNALASSLESLKVIAKAMQAIGVYYEEEHKSASTLLITLSRAMVLLDPERTEQYFAGYVEEYLKKNGLNEDGETAPTGQYL